MKLFKKMRKGFTLIELVVVIAVIAILSAVAVVSYLSITNKAKQSNDEQKVYQVNLSLTAQEISGKPKTMYDALQGVKEDGFLPENFKAEAKDYTFAYKMSENRFVILKNNKVVYPKGIQTPNPIDLWLFSDNGQNLTGGYSYYLRGEITNPVTVSGGVDVGSNANIPQITYTSSSDQDVIIRTYGGKLIVNDAYQGELKIHGVQDNIEIQKCAMNSAHIFGNASFVSIQNGHVEIEKGAKVNGLHFVSTTENNKTGFDDIKVTINNGVDRPEFSRDGNIDIEEEGTLVANISTNGQDEFVWLTKNGIYEQVMVSSTENGTKTYASDGSEEQQSIALEICNNFDGRDGSEPLPAGVLDDDRNIVPSALDNVVDSGVSIEDAEKNTPAILEGNGSMSDPFIIRDARTYCAWRDTGLESEYSSMFNDDKYLGLENKTMYVRCVGTIDLDGVQITRFNIRNYVIDGNGSTIINAKADKNLTNYSKGIFGHCATGDVTLKDLTVKDSTLVRGLIGDGDCIGTITFENISLENVKTGHSFFICQPNANTVNFKNCDLSSDCLMNDNDGWYSGGYTSCVNGMNVLFEDCDAKGTMISSCTSNLGGFVGEADKGANLTFRNCTNEMRIISTASCAASPYFAYTWGRASANIINSTYTGTMSAKGTIYNNGFDNIATTSWTNNFSASNYEIVNDSGLFKISYVGSNVPAKIEIATSLWGLDEYQNERLVFGNNWCKYAGSATKWLTSNGTTLNTGWAYFNSYSNVVADGQNLHGITVKGISNDLSVLNNKECNIVDGTLYYNATKDGYGNWSILTNDSITFSFTEYAADGSIIGMGNTSLAITPYSA